MTVQSTPTGLSKFFSLSASLGVVVMLGALGSGVEAQAAQASQLLSSQELKIDRSLFGSRTGLLTKVTGKTVVIDQTTFPLVPGALIEDKHGRPLMAEDMRWDSVEYRVQYWLGRDLAHNHIVQMIVSFPE